MTARNEQKMSELDSKAQIHVYFAQEDVKILFPEEDITVFDFKNKIREKLSLPEKVRKQTIGISSKLKEKYGLDESVRPHQILKALMEKGVI